MALSAAREHGDLGNTAYEMSALHLAGVFGAAATVTGRLDALVQRPSWPLGAACAEHVAGLAARDGKRLDRAAVDLAVLGAPLFAALAATEAAHCHAEGGSMVEAILSGERAHAYAELCDGFVGLPRPGDPTPALTNREREVARMAAAGLSNADVAARMVLSVRTVETHLSRVYTKLGCAGRVELAALLAVPDEVRHG
jgi:DNA-binding CsgD family transcriptional regulator